MSVYMFDLEGTLSDSESRIARLLASDKSKVDWQEYYAGLLEDNPRPLVVVYMQNAKARGNRVVIYSTRFLTRHCYEAEWLAKQGLREYELKLRDDPKTPGPKLVTRWARRLGPVVLADDRPEVRARVAHACPDCLILSPESIT